MIDLTLDANQLESVSGAPEGALDFAIETALAAGGILRHRVSGERTVELKGEVDLVTDADHASEELIASRIAAEFPGHRFVGEEGSHLADRAPERAEGFTWVVDPIDGTTNFAHGYPHFCVSIALERDGEVLLGAVYNPMLDEVFSAEQGAGARLNGMPIYVSDTSDLIESLLATGFAYNVEDRDENSRVWNAFLPKCRGVRRDGSAALNLCYVAAGRLDGFWERPIQPWDIAAGALIVMESGGVLSGYGEHDFDPWRREVIATNRGISGDVRQIVNAEASGRS